MAYHLASRFADIRKVVASLPVEFATAGDAATDRDQRKKTLHQLIELSHTNASVEEKHRCGGVVVDIESHVPWYYNSCRLCSRAASRRRDNTFWCSKDWQLQEDQTRVCFKIQLTLRDATSDARFILMGGCGHALVNVSAGLTAAAKGKAKVGEPLLYETTRREFRIGTIMKPLTVCCQLVYIIILT
ncbi:unnamed protein product [Linum trigynum]|uniref:Uncharacterized protein n=1 Tax=Linum trigynum TaxID=586398 RepID=A0AAV2G0P5_9ROSI